MKKHPLSKNFLWFAVSVSFLAGLLIHNLFSKNSSYFDDSFVVLKNKFYNYNIQIFFNFTKNLDSMFQCDNVENNLKFDCNPDEPINENVCTKRGCCWRPQLSTQSTLNVPTCYYPKHYSGYQVIDVQQLPDRIVANLIRVLPSGWPKESNEVKLEIINLNDETLRIKISDPKHKRFQVPFPYLNTTSKKPNRSPLYSISVSTQGLLQICRKSTQLVLLEADLRRLIFSDQFIELATKVPEKYLYGLGEHKDRFQKEFNWKQYIFFNKDGPPAYNKKGYGTHPFYLMVEKSQNERHSHGVLLFNSNLIQVILQPTPAVTWRTIGGILDFYIFLGPTPSDVIKQNVHLLGQPYMPPYWSLGFHLCRYGYKSLEITRQTWQRTINAKIPFDVQWNDIDYMKNNNDFTWDEVAFAGLANFVEEIHKQGMHYVLMFDPGISAGETPGSYEPFDKGLALDIFVKNDSNQLMIGKVWNKKSTVWPDFTNEKAVDYWVEEFKTFYSKIKFDGAWIDMNEPANFLNGGFNGCPNSSLEHPHYVPGGELLSTKTMCMTAKHKAGIHYNIHNIFGLYEAKATKNALETILNKRAFIISRATFLGQGHYSGHWSGDVFSTWDDLKLSIANMLNFNLFGIPLIGTDICGFIGNTTVELCARWSALGAFYPFSRNHNSDEAIEQDPVAMGFLVVSSAKYALELRYSLLPYLYTLFFHFHIAGETVVRPLFFEFPKEDVYSIDTQFLWGSSVMIIPGLEKNKNQTLAYFPKAKWYDFAEQTLIENKGGKYVLLNIPLDKIVVVIKGGCILPLHPPGPTTTEARKGKFSLFTALNEEDKAFGQLYWDDGESLNKFKNLSYSLINFSFSKNTLLIECFADDYKVNMFVNKVIVVGLGFKPKHVFINEVSETICDYNFSKKSLICAKLDIDLLKKTKITFVK